MVSEPYELQPLGMDSFVPPSNNPESHTRLDNMEPVQQQNTGYMVYPPQDGGMHPTDPVQLVNNQQQQQQQQQQQHGSLVTDNSMMPLQQNNEPRGFIPEPNLPPQNASSMFIMSKPDIMNNTASPVSSNESLSMSSPASTPDLSGRAPPKHSALAAASAKSRRKHDRVCIILK